MITIAQARKFVRIRNKSEFNNNLQFGIDCRSAGFSVKELGQALKIADGHFEWHFPWGKLVEQFGIMTCEVS